MARTRRTFVRAVCRGDRASALKVLVSCRERRVRSLLECRVTVCIGVAEGDDDPLAVETTPLGAAAWLGGADLAWELLCRGANTCHVLPKRDVEEACSVWSPLHCAARRDSFELAELLLCSGAAVVSRAAEFTRRRGSWECTALGACCSCDGGGSHVLELILSAVGDLRSWLGQWETRDTPLHVASVYGNVECAKCLMDRGLDIDAKTFRWETPLCLACDGGHLDMVSLLVERGASLVPARGGHTWELVTSEDIDDDGATVDVWLNGDAQPLYHACLHGSVEISTFLLCNGAPANRLPELANRYERPPLRAVLRSSAPQAIRQELAELLISSGADVLTVVVDDYGLTERTYSLCSDEDRDDVLWFRELRCLVSGAAYSGEKRFPVISEIDMYGTLIHLCERGMLGLDDPFRAPGCRYSRNTLRAWMRSHISFEIEHMQFLLANQIVGLDHLSSDGAGLLELCANWKYDTEATRWLLEEGAPLDDMPSALAWHCKDHKRSLRALFDFEAGVVPGQESLFCDPDSDTCPQTPLSPLS